ncbi:NADPH-dependent F420 reductase [Streptomyces sp. NPDC090499]|uniref:NADPH-dependent F420 reductase n=1 Tax=Streptomyces sp. NPDC090499 TaxID=3365965 RepID=UPI0038097BA2
MLPFRKCYGGCNRWARRNGRRCRRRTGMSTQVVGIIGSGKIGTDVARLATAAGLQVAVSNSRGPESLSDLVEQLGPLATAATSAGAARSADIVVLALPLSAFRDLPAEALAGKTVVDATNYYPQRDGQIAELDAGRVTSSELVQRALPEARVVKALNTVDFIRLPALARPSDAADRTALPVAGDDLDAKAAVVAFLDAIGFDAVDAGSLSDGWRFQPGTPTFVAPYSTSAESAGDDPARAFLEAVPVPVHAVRARELLAAASRDR